jgi:ProP effector
MTDTPTKPRRTHPVLDTLVAGFPVFRDALPLAIGIHKAIKQRLPDLDAAQLRIALKSHTASTRYLKALSNGDKRFDLDGNPAGEITPEQRQQALDTIKERFRKAAERKREAQQQQELQAQQAKQQEKLLKLAEKFNQR